jgi:hypothetical protein
MKTPTCSPPIGSPPGELKALQRQKIARFRDALVVAGLETLDQQAKALGLARSTTWTIIRADHKASGLSASIINRILQSPHLPPLARTLMLEYVNEKAAGLYGAKLSQQRRFIARISGN